MKTVATLVVGLGIVLAVAACGGGSETEPPADGGAAGLDVAAADEASRPAPAAAAQDAPPASETPPPTGASRPAEPGTAAGGDEPATEHDHDDETRFSRGAWTTDFERHTVPLGDILGGGPSKDGIPPIDEPTFEPVEQADEWLEAREPVIELDLDGEVRGYPLQVLIWHEIVNDTIGTTPVSVTFCPLCNTAIAFDRRLDDLVLDFGTTGNLRNANLVMYDRQTETWWQQFGGDAIIGQLAGQTLTQIPARIVAWEDFSATNPDAQVLSRNTGFSRPYGQNPYTGYDNIDSPPFFPTENRDDDRLPPKERVVFVEVNGDALVVPFPLLEQKQTINVEVGGEQLEISWVAGVRSALDTTEIAEGRDVGSGDVRSLATGERVPFDQPLWFSVAAFRPDAPILGAD